MVLEILGTILATSTAKSVIKFVDEKITDYVSKKYGNKPPDDIEALKKEIEELKVKLETKEKDEITQTDIDEINKTIAKTKQKQVLLPDTIISDSIFQEWYEKNLDVENQVPIVIKKLEKLIDAAKELNISEEHRLIIQNYKTIIQVDIKEMIEARRKARMFRLTVYEEKAKGAEISLRSNILDAENLLKPYYVGK